MKEYSARDIIAGSYRFVFEHPKSILTAIGIPLGLAAIVLLVLFKVYFSLLAFYLSSPDGRLASLTISATFMGFFVWLLLNVVACARLARLVRGSRTTGLFTFQGMALEARLYAAVLRYLLALFAVGALSGWAASVVPRFSSGRQAEIAVWLAWLVFAAFATAFFVRCGLLLPALAAYERRWILRRGWNLSRGHSWRLVAVAAVTIVLPFVFLQTLGEFLSHQFIRSIPATGAGLLAEAAKMLATDELAIAAIVLSLSLSAAVCLTLATVSSCLTYQRLTEHLL